MAWAEKATQVRVWRGAVGCLLGRLLDQVGWLEVWLRKRFSSLEDQPKPNQTQTKPKPQIQSNASQSNPININPKAGGDHVDANALLATLYLERRWVAAGLVDVVASCLVVCVVG